MTKPDQIPVPLAVLEGLEAVRRSGLTNMFDRPVVAQLAEEFGYPEAAEWIRGHRGDFAHGIIRGFRADPAREITS